MSSKKTKSKSDVVAINDQKVVDEIVKEVQSKKKKEKVKPRKKEHKKIIAIILIIFLVVALIGGVLFYKYDKERVVLEKQLKIEVGSSIPLAKDYIKKTGNLSNYIEIIYKNEKGKKVSLETKTIYLKDNKEIDESEALEENKKTLKKDVKRKEIVLSVGNFIVEIKDKKSKKIYTSRIVINDTKAPSLKLRSVEKQENESISIEDFVEECKDNSKQNCQLSFVKEKKDEKTKKVSYEEIKEEDIDKSVGDERDIFIQAKDKSNNATVQKTTLKITKKAEEPQDESLATGGSSGSSNRGGSNSSGGNRGSNSSGGSASAQASCGQSGYALGSRYGAKTNLSEAYVVWGCGKGDLSSSYVGQLNSQFSGASTQMIAQCQASGRGCWNDYDSIQSGKIFDVASGEVVGIRIGVRIYEDDPNDGYGGTLLGSGYYKPNNMVWQWRNF